LLVSIFNSLTTSAVPTKRVPLLSCLGRTTAKVSTLAWPPERGLRNRCSRRRCQTRQTG
jgi:hypothetical protein